MTKHVISTLSADNRYTNYVNSAGLNMPDYSVLVKGGAGVALIGNGRIVDTPNGVRTEVTDEEAAFLKTHPHFIEHEKRGFVKIINVAKDPEKVAESMEEDKGSKPKTPKDVATAANNVKDVVPVQAVTNTGK